MAKKATAICIHGYTSNSQVHRLQMKPIEEALPDCEFLYPDAPHSVTMESQPIDPNLGLTQVWAEKVREYSTKGHLAWWFARDDEWIDPETGNFFGLEESIETIGQSIAEVQDRSRPVIIMGMSQGACFAAMLCALFEEKHKAHPLRKHLPEKLPPVAGVIFGGFKAEREQYASLYNAGIEAPMLHVTGDSDKLISVERREALIQACRLPTILRFDGGHEVPRGEGDRKKIVNFVRAHLNDAREVDTNYLKAWALPVGFIAGALVWSYVGIEC